MDATKLSILQDFVEQVSESGTSDYDWAAEIHSVEEDHVVVNFIDLDLGLNDGDVALTGKLSIYSDTLMAWQADGEEEPIIFSNRPWVLVAITYAGE